MQAIFTVDGHGMMPCKANDSDAAFDLFSPRMIMLYRNVVTNVFIGVRVDMEGCYGLICPRSGLATKGVTIVNSPGVIDEGYKGEIGIILTTFQNTVIQQGQAIAQIIFMPTLTVATNGKYANTKRGAKGFGSSDA